jgi:hypothetical protein
LGPCAAARAALLWARACRRDGVKLVLYWGCKDINIQHRNKQSGCPHVYQLYNTIQVVRWRISREGQWSWWRVLEQWVPLLRPINELRRLYSRKVNKAGIGVSTKDHSRGWRGNWMQTKEHRCGPSPNPRHCWPIDRVESLGDGKQSSYACVGLGAPINNQCGCPHCKPHADVLGRRMVAFSLFFTCFYFFFLNSVMSFLSRFFEIKLFYIQYF